MAELDAKSITELLRDAEAQQDAVVWIGFKKRVAQEAPVAEIAKVLDAATDSGIRRLFCEILGKSCDGEAVPILIGCLSDPSQDVAHEAADALGRIGDPAAGPALMEHLIKVEQDGNRSSFDYSALAAVGYRPAIPFLIRALNDPQPLMCEAAAWSLGILGAQEALEPLRQALAREPDPDPGYYKRSIEDALATIEMVGIVDSTTDKQAALNLLIPALEAYSNTMRGAAAEALGNLGAKEAEVALQTALAEEEACFVARRMREALRRIAEHNQAAIIQ